MSEKGRDYVGDCYLGDGLYARFDGFQVELYCDRYGETHWVALETIGVLPAFLKFVESACNVQIKVSAAGKKCRRH